MNEFLLLCALNVDSFCNIHFFPRPQTFISLQYILSKVQISIDGYFIVDHIIVFILEIEGYRFKFCWIDKLVNEVVVDVKSSKTVEVILKFKITDASLSTAPFYMDSYITKERASPLSR